MNWLDPWLLTLHHISFKCLKAAVSPCFPSRKRWFEGQALPLESEVTVVLRARLLNVNKIWAEMLPLSMQIKEQVSWHILSCCPIYTCYFHVHIKFVSYIWFVIFQVQGGFFKCICLSDPVIMLTTWIFIAELNTFG